EELSKKEKIRWAGRPDLEMQLFKAWFLIPVGILFLLIGGTIGIIMVAKLDAPMNLIGIGVLLICVALSVPCFLGRMLIRRFAHRRAVFLITNRRAIVFHGKSWGSTQMQSWNAVQMRKMERQDSSWWKGCGSIVFEYKLETHTSGGAGRGPGRSQ